MADKTTTVNTLDIQLLDASRANPTLIKLDNPIENVTKQQVLAVMQPALTNEWFLSSKGDIALYIGDVTLNTSIKTVLSGGETYITPATLTIDCSDDNETEYEGTLTVTNGVIQSASLEVPSGFPDFTNNNVTYQVNFTNTQVTIKIIDIDNYFFNHQDESYTCTAIVIIEGVAFRVPVTVTGKQD